MQNAQEQISIIIPVYNEAQHIYANLKEIKTTFDNFGYKYEIVVCDDGSTDDTVKEVIRFAHEYKALPLKLTHNRYNYGKGRTLKKAFKYARGEYVIFLDADLDLHPSQIQTFFDIMRLTNADIVIGSKRHPNSLLSYPLQRKIMSYVYFLLVKLLFGLPIHDTQTGLKLFRREVLQKVFRRVLIKRFAFDLEILVNAHHLGYLIEEAPVIIKSQRMYGRIGVNSVGTMLWDTLTIWYRMYILHYYDRIDHYRRQGLLREFKRVRR